MKIRIMISAALCSACSQAPGPVVPKTPVERQMIGLLQKFDRWDDDGSGELDESELAAGLKGTAYKPSKVIDFYDTSGNRKISLREAQVGYGRAGEVVGRTQP
jgi:hypothetical protein